MVKGILQAHQELAGIIFLGPGKFVPGNRALSYFTHLFKYGGNRGKYLAIVHAGVDKKCPGVIKMPVLGAYFIGQAFFLSHFIKQAAGHIRPQYNM